MTKTSSERRSAARRSLNLPNGVEIRVCGDDGPSHPIVAKLVDASPGGVGVEAFTRLSRGSRVLVRANLHATELDLAFSGEARVAHSREVGPGRYRIGLELDDVRYARAS